jgi:hypothetical protein
VVPAPSASDSTNPAQNTATGPRGPGPGGTDATQPATPATTSGGSGTAPTPSASASAAAQPAPTLEIKSVCPDTLHLSIGPNTSQLSDVTVPGRTSVNVKRDADGSQTVWIVTAKKAPPTPVRATATTKRIVIDIDCRSVKAE